MQPLPSFNEPEKPGSPAEKPALRVVHPPEPHEQVLMQIDVATDGVAIPADTSPSAKPPSVGEPVASVFPKTPLIWLAGMMFLSVPMVTLIDIPIARWFGTDPLSRELQNALELMRVFSHGSGVFLILMGVFLMAPKSRWHLPRLATLAVGAGAVATMAKMFVLRPRPTGLNLDVASMDSAWLWAFDWTLSQVATFDASTRAFPSSNMATAIALTVGLWAIIPSGRLLFALICFGTFLQRLACGAHFPSDVLGGAAFGLLWAYICFHPKLLGNLFDKMQPESEPKRRRSIPTAKETAATA